MKDREDDQIDRLFENARRFRPKTGRLAKGFETRVTAGIRMKTRERESSAAVWFSWQWRLAPAFVLLVLILSAVTFFATPDYSHDLISSLLGSQDTHHAINALMGD